MSYTLRVPIRTLGDKPINDLTDGGSFRVEDVDVSLAAKPPYLVLKATGFHTEDEAKDFIPRVIAGFWSLAVRWNIAFKADFRPQPVMQADNPDEAGASRVGFAQSIGLLRDFGHGQGLANTEATIIYPSDQKVRTLGMGEARLSVSTPANAAIPTLRNALGFPNAATIVADARFRTAMELYVDHFYETSPKARFLSLMTVLEVLAPTTKKHLIAQELIRRWKDEINAKQVGFAPGSDERAALESLNRELDFRRETSIRMRLRAFIRGEFRARSEEERLRFEREIVAAYDARGELIHAGTLEPNRLSAAHESVNRILRLLLGERLGIPEVR
jgi:hypothetical protein